MPGPVRNVPGKEAHNPSLEFSNVVRTERTTKFKILER
jgi:hypothetical protein